MDEEQLENDLSEPTAPLIAALGRLDGDLVVLGAGGKMGPTLVRLAIRASRAAGRDRRVIAVSRFENRAIRAGIEHAGAEAWPADLLDPAAVAKLPDAPNVIFMAGQKFGTGSDAGRTWAVNTVVPALVAARYRTSRIVAFSSGNVYPFWPISSAGPTESDPVGPVGEYAQSVLGRERILEYFGTRNRTPIAILRLNYANEPRYGVLRDIADRVRAGESVDLGMGVVNVIWQRDANEIALRSLEHCAVPPWILNLTGPPVGVRAIAEAFGRRWGIDPRFAGEEAGTALLSDPARSMARFGPPATSLESMIDRVAGWIESGGASLGRPTHFAEREGRF